MLGTLIKKEILEAILSLRFLLATVLCLILIPVGMYVNVRDYQRRLTDYEEAVRLYEGRSRGTIQESFQAEGFRPPSVLSIFSVGLEYILPNKIVTSRTGAFQTSNELGIDNPQSMLFGKVDLVFNVSVVLSLLAFILTFNSVAGEKEDGTLKLIMSNAVPRWRLLVSKIVGNYIVLLVPFLTSMIIALIGLSTAGVVPLFSANIALPLVVILFVTLIFILSIFNLGIFVSTLTHRSLTSIVALLFVWTLIVLSLPKISPMIAEIIHPVKSQQVMNIQRSIFRESLEKKRNQELRELYGILASNLGLNPNRVFTQGNSDEERMLLQAFDSSRNMVEQKYEGEINQGLRKMDEDYENSQSVQVSIGMNLSRLSPVSSYAYIVSDICATGAMEVGKFRENARRFQDQVKESLYDKFIIKSYTSESGSATSTSYAPGFDPRNIRAPQLEYRHTSMAEALGREWVDILLLFLFNIVFFIFSYAAFLRYDVR